MHFPLQAQIFSPPQQNTLANIQNYMVELAMLIYVSGARFELSEKTGALLCWLIVFKSQAQPAAREGAMVLMKCTSQNRRIKLGVREMGPGVYQGSGAL